MPKLYPRSYTKKPVTIKAFQLIPETLHHIVDWLGLENLEDFSTDRCEIRIKTLEGVMTAKNTDFVIQGVKGEFYPCKRDIFEASYNEDSHS